MYIDFYMDPFPAFPARHAYDSWIAVTALKLPLAEENFPNPLDFRQKPEELYRKKHGVLENFVMCRIQTSSFAYVQDESQAHTHYMDPTPGIGPNEPLPSVLHYSVIRPHTALSNSLRSIGTPTLMPGSFGVLEPRQPLCRKRSIWVLGCRVFLPLLHIRTLSG